MKSNLVYELRGKTEDGRWLIVGYAPAKPNVILISIYFADTMDVLRTVSSLSGMRFEMAGAS